MIQEIQRLWCNDARVAVSCDDTRIRKIEKLKNLREGVAKRGNVDTATGGIVCVSEVCSMFPT